MTETIVITLAMLGCIGLGVLLGWSFWGSDAKYYKNLAEAYKEKLASPEVKEAILEKRAKDVVNKFHENHRIPMHSGSICMKSDCVWRKNCK